MRIISNCRLADHHVAAAAGFVEDCIFGSEQERVQPEPIQPDRRGTHAPFEVTMEPNMRAKEPSVSSSVPPSQWLTDWSQDCTRRTAMIRRYAAAEQVYSDMETTAVKKALSLFAGFASHHGAIRHLSHQPTVNRSRVKFDKQTGLLVGEAELVIRGASCMEVVAYLMDYCGKHWRSRLDPSVDVRDEVRTQSRRARRHAAACAHTHPHAPTHPHTHTHAHLPSIAQVLEVKSDHHTIILYEGKAAPFRNREFVNALIWKQLSENQFVWCSVPVTDHVIAASAGEGSAVRAEATRCIRLTQIGEGVTTAEYCCSLDLKGLVPTYITNRICIPQSMHLPYRLQLYFAQCQPRCKCAAEDGTHIGHMLMDAALAVKRAERAAVVAAFFARTAMLRETPAAHFATLLEALVMNRFKLIIQDVAAHDPAILTEAEAMLIGHGFAPILLSSTMPEAAVEEFILTYRAMGFLAEGHVWMRPLLFALAKRQMANAPLGAALA